MKATRMSGGGFLMQKKGPHLNAVIQRPVTLSMVTLAATRTWRGPGISPDGCAPGEAFIGDTATIGATRGQYRAALKWLTNRRYATTKATNNGTIIRLLDSILYELNVDGDNHHNNHQRKSEQPSNNHRTTTGTTTNKNLNKGKNIRRGGGETRPGEIPFPFEDSGHPELKTALARHPTLSRYPTEALRAAFDEVKGKELRYRGKQRSVADWLSVTVSAMKDTDALKKARPPQSGGTNGSRPAIPEPAHWREATEAARFGNSRPWESEWVDLPRHLQEAIAEWMEDEGKQYIPAA
jgi:hypothetical protein